MTEGLDGSFRYPKCAYLAAISAQVCPSIRSRRHPCKPQRFTAAWTSGLRSDVIRARSCQLSYRQHFLPLKFGGRGQAHRNAITRRRSAAAIGLESTPLSSIASCVLTISPTKSCSSRTSRIIPGEAVVTRLGEGLIERCHWLLNNSPPMTTASNPVVSNRTSTRLSGNIAHTPPVSNERLKFKHSFETNASPKKGTFVDSYGLRLFGCTGQLS